MKITIIDKNVLILNYPWDGSGRRPWTISFPVPKAGVTGLYNTVFQLDIERLLMIVI